MDQWVLHILHVIYYNDVESEYKRTDVFLVLYSDMHNTHIDPIWYK